MYKLDDFKTLDLEKINKDDKLSYIILAYLNNETALSVFKTILQDEIKSKINNNLMYVGYTNNLYSRVKYHHLGNSKSYLRENIIASLDLSKVTGDKIEFAKSWIQKNLAWKYKESTSDLKQIIINDYNPPFNRVFNQDKLSNF